MWSSTMGRSPDLNHRSDGTCRSERMWGWWMSTERRLPTSADVARAAGVSRSTVSYVLNATPGARVAEETRKRVLATADELGYVPNMAAADLRRGTSRIILIVIERQRAAHVITEFMSSIADALREHGFTMLTLQVSGDVTGEDARSWATLRPAVVFSVGTRFSADARKVFKRSKVVLIGEYDADVRWFFDQGPIAAAGAQALLERGRNGILQILPDDPSLAEFTAPRVAAFVEATGSRGLGTVHLPLGPALAAFVQELPTTRPECDGLVVHNDEYAALVVGALLDVGIDVPLTDIGDRCGQHPLGGMDAPSPVNAVDRVESLCRCPRRRCGGKRRGGARVGPSTRRHHQHHPSPNHLGVRPRSARSPHAQRRLLRRSGVASTVVTRVISTCHQRR